MECPRCGLKHKPGQCSITGKYPLAIRSYALYKPPLIKAILELKYRPNRALGRVMAEWLKTIYQTTDWHAELVIPVPLAVARRRQRGYNQVELISSPLAEALNLPHYRNALKRVRDTGSQVGRDFLARRDNVEGAFSAEPHICDQKNVLLIDDLVTTGATIHACSQALLQAGAVAICALTVGRASR
jgi:competence protein ComFC